MKKIITMLLLLITMGCGTSGPKWSAEDGTPIMVPKITTNSDNVISTNLAPLVIHEVK